MAPATVVKTVGTSGRAFTTLALWQAAAPTDLTTAEKWSANTFIGSFIQGETITGTGLTGEFLDSDGATYIVFGITSGNSSSIVTLTGSTSGATCIVSAKTNTGVIWWADCYADSEFTVASNTQFVNTTGNTTSSTAYFVITAATGQSFQDQVSVRTNALVYDKTKGVAFICHNDASACFDMNNVRADRVTRIQFQNTGISNGIRNAGRIDSVITQGDGELIRDCILTTNTLVFKTISLYATQPVSLISFITNFFTFESSTVVKSTSLGTVSIGIDCGPGGSYLQQKVVSCAIFGFTTPIRNGSSACENNATNTASLPGSSNQTSVTYSSTTPFTQASNTSSDLRAIAATALAANGFLDATNAPNDISNYMRANPPTIGAWEITHLAAMKSRTFILW